MSFYEPPPDSPYMALGLYPMFRNQKTWSISEEPRVFSQPLPKESPSMTYYYTGKYKTLQQAAGGAKTIYYGARTCWWTTRQSDLCRDTSGMPCDPRGGPLFQTNDVKEFLDNVELAAVRDNAFGKYGVDCFLAAYHGNLVADEKDQRATCFETWDEYEKILDDSFLFQNELITRKGDVPKPPPVKTKSFAELMPGTEVTPQRDLEKYLKTVKEANDQGKFRESHIIVPKPDMWEVEEFREFVQQGIDRGYWKIVEVGVPTAPKEPPIDRIRDQIAEYFANPKEVFVLDEFDPADS